MDNEAKQNQHSASALCICAWKDGAPEDNQ
jgi:hypothetical protein